MCLRTERRDNGVGKRGRGKGVRREFCGEGKGPEAFVSGEGVQGLSAILLLCVRELGEWRARREGTILETLLGFWSLG